MAFRHTITFSAAVSDYTDGTVSARVQAENEVLRQFAEWIQTKVPPRIQVLEKVSIGDSEWAEWPFFAKNTTGSIPNAQFTSLETLTDVYFFGENTDNYCLGMTIDDHKLTIAPTISMTKQRELNTLQARALSIVMEQLRRHNRASTREESARTSLDLATFDTTAATVSVTFYWYRGANALIISRSNTGDYTYSENTPKLIFTYSGENDTFAHINFEKCLAEYSFREPVPVDVNTQNLTRWRGEETCLGYHTGGNIDPYFWGNMTSYSADGAKYNSAAAATPRDLLAHKLLYASMEPSRMVYSTAGIQVRLNDYPVAPLPQNNGELVPSVSGYVPPLETGEIFLRRLWVPQTRTLSEIRLAFIQAGVANGIPDRAIFRIEGAYYLSLGSGVWGALIPVTEE